MPPRGRFITFEGGEGAGKSTQARLLVEALARAGIEVLLTREPGGSPGAEQIRRLLVEGEVARWDALSEALLHFAARRDHLTRAVRPALAAGQWVVSDRFADSTMAYQGYGHGVDRAFLHQLSTQVVAESVPDLTLVLDLPAEAGLARARQGGAHRAHGEDRYERMDIDFHRRLRAGFAAIAAAEPVRCALIDASGDAAAVQAQVRAVVADRLGAALA